MRAHPSPILSWLVVGAAGWLVVGPPPGVSAAAASLTLTDRQRQEAIRVGQRSIVLEQFDAEWRVQDGNGQSALVMTPFHRVALEARKSAFKRQPLKPKDVDDALKQTTGKLVFWVTLKGPRADFARFYAPLLKSGKDDIEPSFVQNERTAIREEDGRFAARCLYTFPAEGVAATGRLTLLVRDPDEKEIAKFTVDLSGMR